MNRVRISTIIQYFNLLGNGELNDAKLFRGQANSAWQLSPSLERVKKSSDSSITPKNWMELENELLDDFKLYSTPYLNRIPENKLEWLVQAQHHGLPTALLDLTSNPLKALFFAVESTEYDNADGAVFLLNGGLNSTEAVNDMSINYSDHAARCFYPKHINSRITAQDSCFFLYSLPPDFEPFPLFSEPETFIDDSDGFCYENYKFKDPLTVICKVIIPKDYKATIRRELERLGITTRTIYPGLDGIAKSIKQKLSDGSLSP